jgi:uncharacterized membrane protein YdjX (TVP38/TMEM64 family)
MKTHFLLKWILVAGTPLLLWASREPIAAMWRWFSDRSAVEASISTLGIWGPVVLFILFVLQVFFAFIPGQALMVACGFLYGFWSGFLISWLSLVVGGELAFVLARRYGRTFAAQWISTDVLARWDKSSTGQDIAFFAVTLFMPLVPNDAMCYVAGLGKISRIRFSIANLLGRGIACALTSAAGAFGGHISLQGWVILIVIGIAVGAIWLVLRNRNLHLFIAERRP